MYKAILIGGPKDKEVIILDKYLPTLIISESTCICTCSISNEQTDITLGFCAYKLHVTHDDIAIYIFNGVKL